LLKPGGRFISITFAQPHFRLPLYALPLYDWNTQTDIIGTNFHYFFYTMTKGQSLSELDHEVRNKYELRKLERLSTVIPISDSEDEDYLLKSIGTFDDDSNIETLVDK